MGAIPSGNTALDVKFENGVTVKSENSAGSGVDMPKNCANPRIPPRVVKVLQLFREVIFSFFFYFLFYFFFLLLVFVLI